ncbi:MAG: glycosyltransferase family 2 protein [Marinicella sp.]
MNIQIIVPIFNAFEVTSDAINALKKYNNSDDVILINDASTDERINGLFNDLPFNWQVLQNEKNLGFVQTANRGMKLSDGHSVLLNSDTLVSQNWLSRFKQVIINIDNLGTATPWSNNAEICSLPETLQVNEIPESLDLLSEQLFNLHQPSYPELPTAVGFCMLVTAAAKNQVGFFDEQVFGLGYGEENDYSLRVSQHGLRNVLVDNCYVAHVGNQSFKERSLKPNEDTMARLLKKHPNYLVQIQKFIEIDPLSELRESIIAKITAF